MRLLQSLMASACLILAATATAYEKNPYVEDRIWYALAPDFIPEDSPEKAALDKIFSKKRVLSSIESMCRAGFVIITNPKDKIIVAKHSYLDGYLLKVYLDTQDIPEWNCFLRRVQGSKVIREAIERHGYEHIMKVPRKWIYPLPPEPSPKPGTFRKDFVLVVEEIDILNARKNRAAYKKKMTPEILDALYTLLTRYLLIDSVYADNVPFCKDGRMAFVDTEYTGDTTRPVPLTAVGQYLSKEMLGYWEQLLIHGIH